MRLKSQVESVRKYFNEFIEYRRTGKSIYAIERLAQLLIQSILDFGAMLTVYMGLEKPETYRGIMKLIAEKLGLSRSDQEFLVRLAGFRNILVHAYTKIDRELEEKTFSEIEERIAKIVSSIENYIEKTSVDPQVTELSRRLEKVFRKHNVKFAFLFGSIARKGFGRDYDIAVYMDLKNLLELGELIVDIAEALGVNEDRIDLVHLNTAPPNIIYTILLEGKLIHGNKEEALDYLYKKYLEILDINEQYRTITPGRGS